MKRAKKPKPGQCQRCGCTDANACDRGCGWDDPTHTLCTRCASFADFVSSAFSETVGAVPIFALWAIDVGGPFERGRWLVDPDYPNSMADPAYPNSEQPTVFIDRKAAMKVAAVENDPKNPQGLACFGCEVLVIELMAKPSRRSQR